MVGAARVEVTVNDEVGGGGGGEGGGGGRRRNLGQNFKRTLMREREGYQRPDK
jgi:hypothetical protein